LRRYGNLYSRICDVENLRLAHARARRGKSYYTEVKMVDANPDRYLLEIQRQLLNRTYRTSRYKIFIINDGGKEREIYKLPYYPDRIVHHAVMNVIKPTLLNTFIHNTYAAIEGRGIHAALKMLHSFMRDRDGSQYCLKLDVAKFFPSVDHTILKQLLRRKFKDPELLWLLDEIIDSIPGGKGLPIGNYTSQYLANFYLTYFDHWLKEEKGIKYYLRYMDDMVILHGDKSFLHQLRGKAHGFSRGMKARLIYISGHMLLLCFKTAII